jgi:transcriptional regulator with XRE-family HTH domain
MLSHYIASALAARDLQIEDLAERLHIGYTYAWQIVNGKRTFRARLNELAGLLGVDRWELQCLLAADRRHKKFGAPMNELIGEKERRMVEMNVPQNP